MQSVELLKKEYSLKKERILRRLSEFKKIYSEKVSWFYESGKMMQKPVSTLDDERIFEELVFCICTANTSAVMGLKAVDSLRGHLMHASQSEMAEILTDAGYRYPQKRPVYIVHARDFLKEQIGFDLKMHIESLSDHEQRREWFVKNIKGLGFKEASHFLRNIGFKGYAILDKHIINSMHEFGALEKPEPPKNPKVYLQIEQKYKDFAHKIGIDMDELDLLLWSRKNGEILK